MQKNDVLKIKTSLLQFSIVQFTVAYIIKKFTSNDE